MTRNKKLIIIATITVLIVTVAWAPWLDNQSLHDKVFEERGWKDGTITTPEHFENLSDEALQGLLAESRKKGVENGILICDYNVNWFPFGRYIASCEGGYFATFWGKILFPESVAVENPCAVCINGCDTCPEGCEECLIGIEKKLKDPNLKWYYSPEGSQKFNEITIPVFANDEPDTVINSLFQILNSSSLGIEFLNPAKSSQWWISDDGWSIIDPNAVSITSSKNTSGGGRMWPAIGSLAKELNYFISRIFLANDFALNATNTSKSETENEFYDYVVAFQKGETRCTLTTNGDNGEYSVACSDNLQEAYSQQISYLRLLDNRNVIVGIKERIGDFVWLGVHLRRTGFVALVRENEKGMELLFTGQEAPLCNLMIENQVPKEVYEVCYDDFGNLIR